MDGQLSFPDRRRSARQIIGLAAWIHRGADIPSLPCTVIDLSVMGASISAGDAALPNEFTLLMNENGSVRRQCKVVWRRGYAVGVHFVRGEQPMQ
jgi:hypothetical protein